MSDAFEFLKRGAESDMASASPQSYSQEKKIELCGKWHRRGVTVKSLANYFGVSNKTIYSWLKNDRTHVIEELEVKTGLELLVEQISDLRDYESLCMYEASHLGEDQLEIDPESGKARVKAATNKNLDQKVKFVQLARDFRDMQIKLLTQTGLIPKQSERIYAKVGDNRVDAEEEEDGVEINALSQTVMNQLLNQKNL